MEKTREKLKSNLAITLIALVVTIVVLLILAGISLNLVLGNNGIITKAKDAVKRTEEAKVEEELNLKMTETWMDLYTDDGLDEDVLTKLGVVGINKIVERQENGIITATAYVVIENNGGYYSGNINISESDAKFENLEKINGIPDEALVFYKALMQDDQGLEVLGANTCKYNNKIFSLITEEDEFEFVAYVIEAQPMKIRVNSGEDGRVDLPIYLPDRYIEWGDGTSNSGWAMKESYKLASITSEIKLADLPPYDHEYSQINTEYVVSIYGKIYEMDVYGYCYDEYIDQIIAIEDWGNATMLEYLDLSYCTNLRSIASPNSKTFINMTSFDSAFYNCSSLQSIPSDFFDNTPNVTDFRDTFGYCTSLTGDAPRLWERVEDGEANEYMGVPDGRGCFYDCTNFNNYEGIPEYWRQQPK